MMTTGYLRGLATLSWKEVTELGMAWWLWVDTAPNAIRLEAALDVRPAEATHVWGWNAPTYVRLRLDPDLPGDGIVGAILTVGDARPTAGGERVTVVRRPHRAWSTRDGRVAATYPPGLSAHDEMWSFEVRRRTGSTRPTMSILTFLALGGGHA